MIDRGLVGRLLGLSAILVFLGAAGVFALDGSIPFAGGLVLGFALGAVPFASWAWIGSRGLSSRRNRWLAALLVGGKLGLYAGALYLFVARPVVHPVGVLVGITTVAAVFCVGPLLGAPARPREAA